MNYSLGWVFLPVWMTVMACGQAPMPTGPSFTQSDADAIRAVMQAQELAWDSGDIDGFMKGYSNSICFIGRKGLTCGSEKVAANYKVAYPDRLAMGDLTFGITDLREAGADHAWLAGTWQLVRMEDTLSGGFSLLWERLPEGWRIVRDHSY
jgi:ketosteroid isomerase-like protein